MMTINILKCCKPREVGNEQSDIAINRNGDIKVLYHLLVHHVVSLQHLLKFKVEKKTSKLFKKIIYIK